MNCNLCPLYYHRHVPPTYRLWPPPSVIRSDFLPSKSDLLYVELFFKLWLLEFTESVKLVSSSDILRGGEGGRARMRTRVYIYIKLKVFCSF
jgi:hypothetical protein